MGQTNNLKRRIEEHTTKGKRKSKYRKSYLGCKLVYWETCPTRSKAIHRELEIKSWSHDEKEALAKRGKVPLAELNVE